MASLDMGGRVEKGVPVQLRLWVPREEKKVSQCCFKQKNRPTGGEKGAPVELRLRVPKRGKRCPSAALDQTRPTGGEKGVPVLLWTKAEPQEEKKGPQWS